MPIDEKQILYALEGAWVVIQKHAGQYWDTIDDLDRAIGQLTGESDIQVSTRLWHKHRKDIERQLAIKNKERKTKCRHSNAQHAAVPTSTPARTPTPRLARADGSRQPSAPGAPENES